MKKSLLAILSLVLVLCCASALAEDAVVEDAAPAYVIQTDALWGADGGWMVMMYEPDGYAWMDTDANAATYYSAVTVDETVGGAVTMTTKDDWTSGVMYCFFDTAKLGVELETLEMHLKLYVSDVAAMKDSLGEIELISGMVSWIGNNAIRWTIDWSTLQNGWNELTLHYDTAQKLGEVFKPNQAKFMWFAVQNAPAEVELKLADIEIYSVPTVAAETVAE